MNDTRFPHIAVEVTVPEKGHKYKRYATEKRVKRTPGVKRLQSEKYVTTKWDVELANKKKEKVGRRWDRANKYGNWCENRTDSFYEDLVNGNERDQSKERLRAAALERRGVQRKAEYTAWESYEELGDAKFEATQGKHEEMTREEYYQAWHEILNSPEQIAINAANDAHNEQQVALYGDDDLYTIELDEDTDDE